MIGDKRFTPWRTVDFPERKVAERKPAKGAKGAHDYLDVGRWWDRPAHQSVLMQSGAVHEIEKKARKGK